MTSQNRSSYGYVTPPGGVLSQAATDVYSLDQEEDTEEDAEEDAEDGAEEDAEEDAEEETEEGTEEDTEGDAEEVHEEDAEDGAEEYTEEDAEEDTEEHAEEDRTGHRRGHVASNTGEHHLKHPSSTPIEALVIQRSRSSETSPPPGGERYAIGADRGKYHAAEPGVDA
ncbi:hypothetical protein LSAT2_012299 [Lamellibrachia satsuma]|nr:hypothetical protein LSAT2_012301 [Lamellibrachia satsuma]KAI0237233.1 hypothetical protein LSAT2_012299 [Lamellibrachia satsuma]